LGREAIVLFVVAFVVRIAAMLLLDTPAETVGKTAWEWGWEPTALARSLLWDDYYGNPFGRESGPSSWLAPAYPGLIALCMKLFGGVTPATATAIFVVQALASAATCLLLRPLGTVLGLRAAGRLSAWVLAIHPAAVWFCIGRVWDSTLVAAALVGFLVLLLQAGRQASPRQAAITGASYGVLVFLNPAPLAILPAVLWFLAPRQGLRRVLLRLGIFLGAALVVCMPWLVRNQVVLGTFALRPNLGVELCVGNNDLADGRFVLAYHPSSSPRFEHYQQVGEAEYGREALDEALTWISAHPGGFVKLSLYRAMVFWLGELPTHDSRRSGELVASQDPKAWIKWLTNLVTGSLALIAIVAFCRRSADRLLLVGVVGLFPLVYYVTHVSERYRFPMEPLLVFLDVWLILVVVDRWRRRS
jgi:4-amino-4-deoxy-L-arabinose transferase-like glycosyltransferase